jgi:hypothetical protein
VDKVRDVVGLYMSPPENAMVLAVDEKSQMQAIDRTAPILPITPTTPARMTHDYKMDHFAPPVVAQTARQSHARAQPNHRRRYTITAGRGPAPKDPQSRRQLCRLGPFQVIHVEPIEQQPELPDVTVLVDGDPVRWVWLELTQRSTQRRNGSAMVAAHQCEAPRSGWQRGQRIARPSSNSSCLLTWSHWPHHWGRGMGIRESCLGAGRSCSRELNTATDDTTPSGLADK